MQMEKLIIIGSGPAALTAAIYASRAHLNPFVIEGLMPGGQLMSTTAVENWPGDIHILGPSLILRIKEHARSSGARFALEEAKKVDFSKTPFSIITNKNKEYTAPAVIIATGATAKRLGCPGEDEYWGKGVTTCAVCDGIFYQDKPVIVVGGGDTAMENALFMTNFTDRILLVQLLDHLTASQEMQRRVLNNKKITIIYNSTVTAVKGNGERVTHVTVTNYRDNTKQDVETAAVFVSIGLNPNTEIFKGQLALEANGFIKLKDHTQTSVPGVFAAGDVADSRYRQAITSAGSGCMAALDAERYLKEQNSL